MPRKKYGPTVIPDTTLDLSQSHDGKLFDSTLLTPLMDITSMQDCSKHDVHNIMITKMYVCVCVLEGEGGGGTGWFAFLKNVNIKIISDQLGRYPMNANGS